MPHCDPDELALAALGGAADVDTDHLAVCAECRTDLDALRRTVHIGRSTTSDDALLTPPPRVWDGISRELGLRASPEAAAPVVPLAAARPAHPARAARRRWPALAAAAAVAGVAVGSGATWLALRSAAPEQVPADPGRVVATAELGPVGELPASGRASLVDEPDGVQRLDVDLTAAAPPGGDYREVWLLDSDAERLVSLGVLVGTTGQFALPPGLDVGTFPLVDVSNEPRNGDPTHSGDSVARGRLSV